LDADGRRPTEPAQEEARNPVEPLQAVRNPAGSALAARRLVAACHP
jgi:hypothetical protein